MTTPVAEWLPTAMREGPAGSTDPERLLDLLLGAVDEQAALLARDVDQVYDDYFIESCRDWAIPYIGSLLGLPSDATRLEVANTIALRRRKGTPAALEDFAEVITRWTARVIDGWQVTACAHKLDHPAGPRSTVFSFKDNSAARLDGPFDRSQRVASPRLGIVPDGVQVFVWPWAVHTYQGTEVAPTTLADRFTLHPSGVESPMYLRPRPLTISRTASGGSSNPVGNQSQANQGRTNDESDAPVRVTYRTLEALAADSDITVGTNWQIADTHPLAETDPLATPPLLRLSAIDVASGDRLDVPWSQLRFGSLPTGDPAPEPPAADQVVVDIHRGTIEVGSAWSGPVLATWHRAVSGEIGALPATVSTDQTARVVITVNPDAVFGPTVVETLDEAVTQAEALSVGLDPALSEPGRPDVEIRLLTSARLAAPNPANLAINPTLPRWRIVAPELMTPTVVGDLNIDLDAACVTLEGFQLSGSLVIGANVAGLGMQNVTMDPTDGATVAIDPAAWGLDFAADRCILAPIRADLTARPLRLSHCIVDGIGAELIACGEAPPLPPVTPAVAPTGPFPPMVSATGVTFHGPVELDSADATDCLFVHGLSVVQTQLGCLRFCYIGQSGPAGLPVTHQCLTEPTPWFESIQFESALYMTLPLRSSTSLRSGTPLLTASSTGGALGAYGHVGAGLRMNRLNRRIGEFVPMGLKPRLIVAKGEIA